MNTIKMEDQNREGDEHQSQFERCPRGSNNLEKEIWDVKVRSLVIFPREEKAHGLTESSGGAELKTIINLNRQAIKIYYKFVRSGLLEIMKGVF